MPRDIPVTNGNLLVNFDLDYRIRDIYFPWIGQENHTRGHEFRLAVELLALEDAGDRVAAEEFGFVAVERGGRRTFDTATTASSRTCS